MSVYSRGETPYINTISADQQPAYPGKAELEWRIRSLVRWNAMAMVVRANRKLEGIGGHISTFASAATLYEVAFNHFFRGKNHPSGGDQVFFQGHASPGIYARAFLEGRISIQQLENFRRELKKGGGLSSYPHPRSMPDFWEFPTVSMGLGPLMGIYQARFNKYLENRGLIPTQPGGAEGIQTSRVWVFTGDGEMDEPESTGAITLASRENLNNLIFVVNCNLQRLDGPVRGNGKIIQELEKLFRGAGWNVIKLVWGSLWDPLLAEDKEGVLIKRMTEVLDGQYQKYAVSSGEYIRKDFFGKYPQLLEMVKDLTDDELRKLNRGGHDPEKVYAAYLAAVNYTEGPTVILAKTLKGYGLGEAGEGKNITHQQKKLNEDELRDFRTRFGIPISDDDVAHAPFYKPDESSPEMQYLMEKRKSLGGFVPSRYKIHPSTGSGRTEVKPFMVSLSKHQDFWAEFYEGTHGKAVSTTMAFVRILSKLLRDKNIGKYIVPIVPDEARTFGMEGLFTQCGIYSPKGQLYEPVDAESLLYYKESKDGQILEEGINEAGAISSFIAAGTSEVTNQVSCIPFYTFYSMFGLQRIGDLVWAASDSRCRGFLMGATAGRTTLAGEGLQHQDGQSHLLAYPVPSLRAYDPAFAYELAVIIKDGLHRMYEKGEEDFYYITLYNENYPQHEMPKGVEEGILKGMYLFRGGEEGRGKREEACPEQSRRVNLFGSGPILMDVLKAAEILEKKHQVSSNIWSVTSYKSLYTEACEIERWNMEHPDVGPKKSYLESSLEKTSGVYVLASDYMRALPDSISRWFPKKPICLGTDGWGMSESRTDLRKHFKVDANSIVDAVLYALKK